MTAVLVFTGAAVGVASAAETSRKSRNKASEVTAPAPVAPAPPTYEEALAKGDAAWRAKDTDRALLNYGQAAQLDTTADIPLLRMASIEEGRKAWARAHQLFELALQRVPDNAAALERFGLLLLREGNHAEATARFNAAIEKDPMRSRSVMGLGLAAQMRGDLTAARRYLDAAMIARPQDPELLTYSAGLWLEQGTVRRAVADARESLRLQPMPGTQLLLGDALARSADYAGALEAYLQALDQPDAYLRLGDEAMRARELTRAQRYFQSALDSSPIYNEAAAKRLAVTREYLADAGRPALR
jgi:Tfp pilus assembly protein PilF